MRGPEAALSKQSCDVWQCVPEQEAREMRIVVIGGTGHIGNFLTEMLVSDGYDVTVLSSGRSRIADESIAARVDLVKMGYSESLADGSFAAMLRDKRADAVVDILQSDIHSVYAQCREAGVRQLVVCGSIWMFGRPKVVPTPPEPQTECPFDGYKTRYAQMREVIAQSVVDGFCANAVMPPNICGPGKIPLDGMGGRSLDVHCAHQRGERVVLPAPGNNLVGPCDAQDVAQGFYLSIKNPEAAAGEIFNVGSAYALTADEFINTLAGIYGKPIPVKLVSPEAYATDVSPDMGANFHFLEHMCPDISKTRTKLGFEPRYTPEQTMERAIQWMFDHGLMTR